MKRGHVIIAAALAGLLLLVATACAPEGATRERPTLPRARCVDVLGPTGADGRGDGSRGNLRPERAARAGGARNGTCFRVATFNVLGANHTAPGGNRPGWERAPVRISRTAALLEGLNVDVVGFQEFQPPQATTFRRLAGSNWQTFPGLKEPSDAPPVNSIAWRTDVWRRVETRVVGVPYFSGVPSMMPYVLLRHVETGQRVWFFNTHNPADVRGDAQQWRDEGFDLEVNLTRRLRRDHPDVPLIVLGDKNDSSRYFCSVAPRAGLQSASGGRVDGPACTPPPDDAIDWIMGTADVTFSGYSKIRDDYVLAISDHPLYLSDVYIPRRRASREGLQSQ